MQHRKAMGSRGTIHNPMIPKEYAIDLFGRLTQANRQAIYDVVGDVPDKIDRAIEYLREPIHAAQFGVRV